MPSLNLSSPGLPGPAAGLFPVASNQVPQVGAGGVSDFAAIMVPPDGTVIPEATGFLDAAPGTPLPPGRKDIAGPIEPLPPTPVEDVMIGALPPAADATAPAEPVVLPEQTPDIAPEPAGIGECRIETWDFHGASRRALPQGSPQSGKPQPVVMPKSETPDLVEPVITALQYPEVTDESVETAQAKAPAPDAVVTLSPPAPPPFAPIDWTRPPAPAPDPAVDDTAETPRPAAVASTLPVRVGTSAKPGPDAISTPPPADQQAQPALTQQQPQSQPQVQQHTPLPQGFTLPPEIAREVAEIVRAAVGDSDEPSAPADSTDSLSSSPVQTMAAPATSLHRDFVATHRPAIDTSRTEWMQAMIERIAEMPQADGKREAQIRLSPDALGTIDVRIEQRQDRMHVTMNADNAQARQLLSEAAPRLQEMAEARGLRLGQTGIGGGEAQDRRSAQEQQSETMPHRSRPAEAAADTSTQPDGDLIA